MSGGEWNTNRERKQLAADQRERDREILRQEKRALRDLRFCAERSTLSPEEWRDFLKLHALHGKEGIRELWESLIPYWNQCQARNGGSQCPTELVPTGLKLTREINCSFFAQLGEAPKEPMPRTTPTTRKAPGAPRKPRTDKGKPRASYAPRKPAKA